MVDLDLVRSRVINGISSAHTTNQLWRDDDIEPAGVHGSAVAVLCKCVYIIEYDAIEILTFLRTFGGVGVEYECWSRSLRVECISIALRRWTTDVSSVPVDVRECLFAVNELELDVGLACAGGWGGRRRGECLGAGAAGVGEEGEGYEGGERD